MLLLPPKELLKNYFPKKSEAVNPIVLFIIIHLF